MSGLPLTGDATTAYALFGSGPTGDVKLLRRRHEPRALLRERAALQRKRLVAKQHLDHNVTSVAGIKRVLCDQVATVSDDLVSVLHDFELLVAIVLMQPLLMMRNGQSRSCAHSSR
jgi:hypothetical protein